MSIQVNPLEYSGHDFIMTEESPPENDASRTLKFGRANRNVPRSFFLCALRMLLSLRLLPTTTRFLSRSIYSTVRTMAPKRIEVGLVDTLLKDGTM